VVSACDWSHGNSEDDMAFGQPTKYWQLNPNDARLQSWDQSVYEASEEYKGHMVRFSYLFLYE